MNIAQTEIEILRTQIKNATNDNKNIKIYIDKDQNRTFIEIDSEKSWIKNETIYIITLRIKQRKDY